jgi:hypothetical protein
MNRFQQRKSLAGTLQPGDATRYEMVAVEMYDTVEVAVLNDGFPDKITFIKKDLSFYRSVRKNGTNPWTIKAAKEIAEMLMGVGKVGGV